MSLDQVFLTSAFIYCASRFLATLFLQPYSHSARGHSLTAHQKRQKRDAHSVGKSLYERGALRKSVGVALGLAVPLEIHDVKAKRVG
jgi:hypothetical protein